MSEKRAHSSHQLSSNTSWASIELLKKVKKAAKSENLEELLEYGDAAVNLELARSSKTGASILEKLATNSSICVTHAVAQHFNTPVKVLQKMLDDNDMLVRDYALRNLKNKILGEENE